jgi:hypothetical protein
VLATCFVAGFFSASCSALKTEATCSSKMSVDLQQSTWCFIPEDRTSAVRTLCCVYVFQPFSYATNIS